MSASQAQLLQLTNQLSDVEFEGQQINRARTQLSSTSAKFYNQLLDMEVPTPPLKTDFTNLVYTYDFNGQERTISNIGTVDKDGKAEITTQYKGRGATVTGTGESIEVIGTEKKIAGKDTSYWTTNKDELYTEASYVGVKNITAYDPSAKYVDSEGNPFDLKSEVDRQMKATNAQGLTNYIDAEGKPATTYQTPMYDNSGEELFEIEGYDEPLLDKNGEQVYDENGKEVWVTHPPKSYDPKRYKAESPNPVNPQEFIDSLGLAGRVYEAVDDNEATSFIGTKAEITTEYKINGASPITFDDLPSDSQVKTELETAVRQTGKNPEDYYLVPDTGSAHGYALVLKTDVKDGNDGAEKLNVSVTNNALKEEQETVTLEFAANGRISSLTRSDGTKILVDAKQEVDEFAYEDAYAEYNYEKKLYDKEQARINKELSTIQQQDKRLELQLTELDTRRTQITTELDSLKTVMKDNIERTYKSFG